MKHKKIRIGIFATSPSLIENVNLFAKRSNDEIILNTSGLDDALPIAMDMVRQGVEVIISRRGTAYLLRENLHIPSISFPHRSFDIISSLKEAATKGGKVIFPVFREKLEGIPILEDLLDIELIQKVYTNKKSHERIILGSKKDGYEVVIGGGVTKRVAKRAGLQFVEIRTSYEDVAATIEDARSIILATRDQQVAAQRYRSIIDATSDGIIALDERGKITAVNSRAASILKVSEEQAIHSSVSRFIEEFPTDEVLYNHRSIVDQLTEIDRGRFVFNCQPIILDDHCIGAVTTLRDISNVMRSEQVVRRSLSKGHIAKYRLSSLIHISPEMKEVVDLAHRYGETDSTILIMGETGTGKEIFAHGIHSLSRRAKQPFVSLNCAALPAQLLESELFGYEEGAFTGSKKGGKAGRFEIAHKGTIFLDEIDSTPEEVQTRLLRVLQEKEVMRLGGDRILPVDVRVIGAASHDLSQAVQEGTFRADLYFRLNVLRLQIPPLRNRLDDIPLLLEFFIELFTKRHKLEPISIPTEYLESLILYPWPGNVRQIRNFVERLVINYSLNSSKKTLEILRHELIRIPSLPETEQLPDTQEAQKEPDATPHQADTLRHRIQAQTSSSERTIIADALKQNRYVKSKTAEMLGISRTTLWRKMKEFDLD